MIDEENQMALQRILNKAVRHCISQGERCMSVSARREGKTCAYYDEGMRCAIGGVVDIETAKRLEREFLGVGVGNDVHTHLSDIDAVVCEALRISPTATNLEFLSDMQSAHDNANDGSFEKTFLSRVRHVAKHFHLEMPALQKA